MSVVSGAASRPQRDLNSWSHDRLEDISNFGVKVADTIDNGAAAVAGYLGDAKSAKDSIKATLKSSARNSNLLKDRVSQGVGIGASVLSAATNYGEVARALRNDLEKKKKSYYQLFKKKY
ncbi:MAG: hypothetical protein KDD60_11600 [Bdellovibrionales bacterium]|nr:hypothetical protein [Bdellovibrionales bacterium]